MDEHKKDHKHDNKNKNGELEKLKGELSEMEHNWKRALADYKNLERSVKEERAAIMTFANTVLIEQLIPVLDNFEILESHTEDMGIKLCTKDFRQVLENVGLEAVGIKEGDEFDPVVMHAVDTTEGAENKVIKILKKAYKFKNKLIRPAAVTVGKKKE